MAFEAITELDTKIDALQVLVDKGILTKHDFDSCKKAISKKNTEKGLIYRDKFIAVYFRGAREEQMLAGKGVKVFLLIENRTKSELSVRARISVNDVIVERTSYFCSDIPEKSKVIAEVGVFYDKLHAIDIYSVSDVETISFLFWSVDSTNKELFRAKKPTVITVNS